MAPRKLDLSGNRYGALVVVAQAHTHSRPGGDVVTYWRCDCDCGRTVDVPGPSLRRKNNPTVTCGDRGAHRSGKAHPMFGKLREESGNWKGDAVAYTTAHARVKAEHGPASGWRCACGCGRQAAEWAYLGTDPKPKVSTHADSKGSLYSTDPEHYAPLAKPCHRSFDVWQAQRHTGVPIGLVIAEALAA
ncbi:MULTISPECIES: hypothetical protein [Streptomyces]|uniref:hypothetical protein n=1 Tax=Streptomyces TaxID=1883 RepID=UPI000CF2A153|nr:MULTISPECIES: hypothetical protein [Streptomyces]PPS67161.1 hypothetical protein BV882_38935 [Streptomyces sp. 46]